MTSTSFVGRVNGAAGSVNSRPVAQPPTNTTSLQRGPMARATDSTSRTFGSAMFTPIAREAALQPIHAPELRQRAARRIVPCAHKARDLCEPQTPRWGKEGSGLHRGLVLRNLAKLGEGHCFARCGCSMWVQATPSQFPC